MCDQVSGRPELRFFLSLFLYFITFFPYYTEKSRPLLVNREFYKAKKLFLNHLIKGTPAKEVGVIDLCMGHLVHLPLKC